MDSEQAKKELERRAGLDSKESKLDFMLSSERKPYQCFSIGEHNGFYYFGTILEYGHKKVPLIITDKGKTFWLWVEKDEEGNKLIKDEIKIDFGLNYRFELFDDCVDNLWSNSSIKSFINGQSKEQKFEKLFKDIKQKNKELMYYPDERVHSFIACDIISNYFYPLFSAKGRTYFQADFGSGKSRQSLIYQLLSFNSLFASNISPASFERVIESTGGTLIVDNFDNCPDELKKQILQCIEVYYKKGGKNIKADGQGKQKNKPIAFNGYSPLVINNIIGLPEVTESRCNKIQLLKTDKKNVVDVKINPKDSFWVETKDNLHILALQKWREVKKVYQDLEVLELSARDLERAEAVLTIAKVIGEDIYKEVLDFLLSISEQQSIREIQDNWDFLLFEFLHKVLGDGETKKIKVAEITACVGDRIISSEKTAKSDKLKFSHYCGKVLNGVVLFKKSVSQGYVHYEISRSNLNKIIKIKGFDKYLHNTTNPTNTTNTTNTTNPTLNKNFIKDCENTHKNGCVGSVGSVQNHTRTLRGEFENE